jgi:hypothetical protein
LRYSTGFGLATCSAMHDKLAAADFGTAAMASVNR